MGPTLFQANILQKILSVKKFEKFMYSTETVLATFCYFWGALKNDRFRIVLHDLLGPTPKCWASFCRAISLARLA
jgi:hypothetical protein